MKIEPLGDWTFRMTSPEDEVVVVQFGEGTISYRDPLDGNTPMSAAELMAEGGITNMLEDRTITLKELTRMRRYEPGDDGRLSLVHNPTTPFTMPLDTPVEQTRACEFKRRWWDNGWKIGDWEPGKWRAWGTDYEEFETGPGMYPVGVVEDSTGGIHSVYVERIRMVAP
jgi:hypothetical protein